jgi:hypothetical protein
MVAIGSGASERYVPHLLIQGEYLQRRELQKRTVPGT